MCRSRLSRRFRRTAGPGLALGLGQAGTLPVGQALAQTGGRHEIAHHPAHHGEVPGVEFVAFGQHAGLQQLESQGGDHLEQGTLPAGLVLQAMLAHPFGGPAGGFAL